jgi:hypothetical protein
MTEQLSPATWDTYMRTQRVQLQRQLQKTVAVACSTIGLHNHLDRGM